MSERLRFRHYPVFLDLHGRPCVVIGGGTIAQRKVAGLLRCGAAVAVVSPDLTVRLRRLAESRRIHHVARRFRPNDLRGAWLAIAATDDETVNQAVARAAARQQLFTNVVDRPAWCSWIAPAVARRGPVTIAISTGGASPTVAKRLRHELAGVMGEAYPRMTRLLGSLRQTAKAMLPRYRDRQRYFEKLVSGPVFELVKSGKTAQARRRALALLRDESELLHRSN